ncbi:hypothetical protein [Anaeromyxobacter sp. SG64]|uniref:hypothetical protein n=1 Tax=Anaeromyxobacter sp. SG64 TaxID=2925409 RepID=UPI001F593E1D|nr:hypothetical protein [Anaeromyxobacter sp. SG64]
MKIPLLARALLALVLAGAAGAAAAQSGAIPLPPPPPGTSRLPASTPGGRDPLRAAALFGFSRSQDGGDLSPMLRLEGVLPLSRTPAGLSVGLVAPLRAVYVRPKEADGIETSGVSFEATPGVRLALPLRGGKAAVRADAGVGVVHHRVTVLVDQVFVGRIRETQTSTTGIFRLGLGGSVALSPKLVLDLEPLSVGYDLDGGADWSFAAGVSFRL